MRKPALLCYAVLLFLSSVVHAEKVKVPPWMYEHIFAVSEKSVFAPALNKDPIGRQALRTLMDYYIYLERNMTAVYASDNKYDELDTGNLPKFLERRGWPEMNKTQRIYLPESRPTPPRNETAARAERARFAMEERRFKTSERLVFNALVNLGESQDLPLVTNRVKSLVNWTHVFHNRRKNYTTEGGTHECKIRANIAYRINGRWSVGATVTNDRPLAFRAERERKFLTEYLYFNAAGRIVAQPLLFDLNIMPEWTRKYWGGRPYRRNSTAEPDARTRVETQMSEWGGQAGIVFFGDRPIEQNIALVAALADSQDLTRQALDSGTLSNSAILILPLFMAALPISVFADVSDAVLLGYIIFTDFLSVIPLGIKGVELVLAGLRKYFSTRTKVWGDLQSTNTVIAATWSCKCKSAINLTALGSIFIAIAVTAVILGVVLEFVAKNLVEKYKSRAADFRGAGSNEDEYLWQRTPPCDECECGAREWVAASQPAIGGGLIGHYQQRRRDASRNADLEDVIGTRSAPPPT